MWDDPQSVVEGELHEHEQLFWSGQPRRGIRLRPCDAFLIPFSILWGGFAIYWEITVLALRSPVTLFFALWGIPFVLVGFHLMFGRFIVDAVRRRRTQYGLTDRRIVTVYAGRGRQVTSVILRNFPNVSLEEKRDGSGSITFGSSNGFGSWLARVPWVRVRSQSPPCLEMVEGVRKLYDLILEAKKAATHTEVIAGVTPERHSTSDKTTSALDAELGPDERLLWADQPDGRVRLRPRDAYVFAVGLMGVAFVLFAAALPLIFGGPVDPLFSLYLAPFALIAAYLSLGRLLVDAHRRRRTRYGLTNERIMVVSGLLARNVASMRSRSLEAISLTERRDGSGSIAFGPPSAWAGRLPARLWLSRMYWIHGFEMIEKVRGTYDTILEALWCAA